MHLEIRSCTGIQPQRHLACAQLKDVNKMATEGAALEELQIPYQRVRLLCGMKPVSMTTMLAHAETI